MNMQIGDGTRANYNFKFSLNMIKTPDSYHVPIFFTFKFVKYTMIRKERREQLKILVGRLTNNKLNENLCT